MNYQEFLESKRIAQPASGIEPGEINPFLFPFQRDIVRWALRRGRACIFADCGMGKTFMQLEWARQIPGSVLILAPLAVAQQTIAEGVKLGIDVKYCRHQDDVKPGITVANYEMLEHFDCSYFKGVVLDESSILKNFMGKTKRAILDKFKGTRFKLACTATPAPNDHMELGNHCEFMEVMSSSEMLSAFFINDAAHVGHYRIKGHAEGRFWEWMASWAVMIRRPSDLGYHDGDFILPTINHYWHEVECNKPLPGELFALPASSLSERIKARRNSIDERIDLAVELANATTEQVLVWCGLNDESVALANRIKDSIEVKGSQSIDYKESSLIDFANGNVRCLISKPTICGLGMNFQRCRNMTFVGLSDSWEQYYQAVRRCWRFGQKQEVNSHVITASIEGAVVANIRRKEADAVRMAESIVAHMKDISKGIIKESVGFKQSYTPCQTIILPTFLAA
jgi:superfamily II DNA or RNA helicase